MVGATATPTSTTTATRPYRLPDHAWSEQPQQRQPLQTAEAATPSDTETTTATNTHN